MSESPEAMESDGESPLTAGTGTLVAACSWVTEGTTTLVSSSCCQLDPHSGSILATARLYLLCREAGQGSIPRVPPSLSGRVRHPAQGLSSAQRAEFSGATARKPMEGIQGGGAGNNQMCSHWASCSPIRCRASRSGLSALALLSFSLLPCWRRPSQHVVDKMRAVLQVRSGLSQLQRVSCACEQTQLRMLTGAPLIAIRAADTSRFKYSSTLLWMSGACIAQHAPTQRAPLTFNKCLCQ